jgi:predicted Ser/Thr protein kinase
VAEVQQRIGAYEVVRVLAHGGMGTVYEARQPALDRAVALKRVNVRTADATAVRRFLHESRIAAALDHPNIVTVHDLFEWEGFPCIAMELLPRGSLRRWVGHLAPAQVLGVLEGVLAALEHAERHGVVHRDLKPENVLVTSRGAVKIADFGIAKALTRVSGAFTATGTAIGTPAYMAPEQAMGRPVGPSADLYAVGAMAFELLSGAPPFGDGAPAMALLYRHVNEPAPRLDEVARGVDPRVADLVAALLAKDPADRPRSAAAAWDALEEIAVDLLGPFWRRDARLGPPPGGTDEPAVLPSPEPLPGTTADRRPDSADLTTTAAAAIPPRGWRRPPRGLVLAGGAVAATVVAALALAPGGRGPPGARRPAPARPFDFDGDGRASAVAGLPGWGASSRVAPTGALALPATARLIGAASAGLPRVPRPGDELGAAVASADFDGDGRADLAAGAPGADLGDPRRREGAVSVLYGSPRALPGGRAELLPGPARGPARAARWGAALAAADLDGDRYADLLVAAPGDARITVIPGGPRGLRAAAARVLRAPAGRPAGFGSVLAVGDVDGDDHPDVAEGGRGGAAEAGAPGHATYCPGTAEGPRRCRRMARDLAAGPASIAIGDVTGDGFADVVQGVPGGGRSGAGAVVVWRGGPRGPGGPPVRLTQGSAGVPGHAQPADGFGAAVALADVDGDGAEDILAGSPGEGEGRVTLVRGARDGQARSAGTAYGQNTPGFDPEGGPGNRFGASLAVLDVTGDRRPDLVVGAPGDAAGTGTVVTFPGVEGGFAKARATTFELTRLAGAGPVQRSRAIRLGRPGAS